MLGASGQMTCILHAPLSHGNFVYMQKLCNNLQAYLNLLLNIPTVCAVIETHKQFLNYDLFSTFKLVAHNTQLEFFSVSYTTEKIDTIISK